MLKENSNLSSSDEEDEFGNEGENNILDMDTDAEAEDEEEVISVSPIRYAMELPSPPNNPYNPHIRSCDFDLEFKEDMIEAEKGTARFDNGVISCAELASKITSEEIMFLIEYYNLEGKWLRPHSFMRMHAFDITGLPTPRMVLTNKLVELGFGSPMHDFLHQIIEYYGNTPVQLSPNCYRAAIGLYMMFRNQEFDIPTMPEVSHFLSLRRCGNDIGFYYLAFWVTHNKKGFAIGNPRVI